MALVEHPGQYPPENALPITFSSYCEGHPYPHQDELDVSRVVRTQDLQLKYATNPELLSRTQIVELTPGNFGAAVKFVREQFAYDAGEDPGMFLAASLTPEDKDSHAFLNSIGLTNSLKYSLTIDEDGEVIGISGLYQYQGDDPNTVWLAWTAVEEAARRHGVFENMFKSLVQKARTQGKLWMKLYTSTDPHESAAQLAYDKLGMNTLSPGQAGYPSEEMVRTIMEPYQDVTTSQIILRGMPLNQ